MSARARGTHRLAIRIYLVTVIAVLAVVLALSVVATVAWQPPPRGGPVAGLIRYAALRVAASWSSQGGVREELDVLHLRFHVLASAYGWDGSLVASAGPSPLAPLSRSELEELAKSSTLERRESRARSRRQVACIVAGKGKPLGYLVAEEIEAPPPAPPGLEPPGDRSPGPPPHDGRPDPARPSPQPPPLPPPVGGPVGPPPPDPPRGSPPFPPLYDASLGGPPISPHLGPGPGVPILLAVLLLVGLGGAAAYLGSSIARPLGRLAQAAHALGSGNLKARTGLARRDELGEVAKAFDDMADRVEALLRAQTELIANIAHELRTPLARIRVALDLAEEGDPSAARESLGEIAEDLSELEQLVGEILTSARMDLARSTATDGTPPLRRARLRVEQLVTDAAERLRHRYPTRKAVVELGEELPTVAGDPVLLRRALDNLVDNARKYSPPETTVRLRAFKRSPGVAIEIVDSGEGLSPADLSRLFTPFFRADRSRSRATGGVGLGLSLSRRIVEAHGGTLTAASIPGRGTTMTIALPSA